MAQLSSFFAIYTDGTPPRADVAAPRGVQISITAMPELVLPSSDSSLFGPHSGDILRAHPRAGFLISVHKDTKGSAGTFFSDVQALLLQTVRGLQGWCLDVLRLYPIPLAAVHELPEDPF